MSLDVYVGGVREVAPLPRRCVNVLVNNEGGLEVAVTSIGFTEASDVKFVDTVCILPASDCTLGVEVPKASTVFNKVAPKPDLLKFIEMLNERMRLSYLSPHLGRPRVSELDVFSCIGQ